MKKFVFFILLLIVTNIAISQGVAINNDGSTADNSAMLDVKSTNSGMLIPRMTQAQRNALTLPAESLIIFQTDNTPGYYYNSGTAATPVWERIATGSDLGFVDGTGVATRVAFWQDANTLSSNANLYWNNTSSRLGVGTGAPSTTLDINGITTSSGYRTRTGNTDYHHFTRNGSGSAVYINQEDATNPILRLSAGTATANGNVRVTFENNGNVGVGTTSPTAQLHTTGTVRLQNYTNGTLQVDANGNLSVGTGSALFTAGNGLTWSGTTLNSLWTASGNNIYNNNTANVGIGTTAPGQKLEVAGTFEVDNTSDGALAYFKGGTDNTSYEWIGFYSGETRQGIFLWDGAWASGGNRTNEFSLTAENGNWLTLSSTTGTSILGGNVGIGTTAPSQKLHIVGNSLVSGNMYVNNANYSAVHYGNVGLFGSTTSWNPDPNGDNGIWIEGTTNGSESGGFFANGDCAVIWSPGDNDILRVYDEDNFSGGPKMVLNGSGNLGVGIDSPTEKLDVVGNIKASGIAYWGSSGSRTENRDNAGLQGNAGAKSGFFETSSATAGENWPTGASSYWHLLDIRHSNPANNYAMQFAGSFYDQKLYFRKTNNNPAQPWTEILTGDYFDSNVVTIESTSTLSITSSTFTVIPGESVTLNNLNAGDRVLIWFSGNMNMDGSDYNTVDVALFINGALATVGGFVRTSIDNDYAYMDFVNYSATARYNVTTDGNYTFDVRARRLLSGNTIYIGGNSTDSREGVLTVFVIKN